MQSPVLNNTTLSHTSDSIPDFQPIAQVSICFIEVDGKILLLKNINKKIENNTWSAPGGKLEAYETPLEALHREVLEETGLTLEINDQMFKHTLYSRFCTIDSILHIFKTHLPGQIIDYPIALNPQEHSEYLWISPHDSLELNLMKGEHEIINLLYF
jgi:8-oxo-dGTP pyrophosphatase MutT (NUDIX family)